MLFKIKHYLKVTFVVYYTIRKFFTETYSKSSSLRIPTLGLTTWLNQVKK